MDNLLAVVLLAIAVTNTLVYYLGFIEGRSRGRDEVWRGEWP